MHKIKRERLIHRLFYSVFILCLLGFASPQKVLAANEVMIIKVDGPISPGTANFLMRGLKQAEAINAALVIVQLDTPGGLGSSMRTMVKGITNSKIPVVVYVSPTGAGAASAGVLITVSAHVAAMAPGTNIGAAHPVSIGGQDIQKTMSEKVVNDMASYGRGIAKEKGKNAEWVERAIRESVSITADEALEKNVIDLVAKDTDDLLQQLDGREVTLPTGKVTLQTGNLTKVYYQSGFRDKLLNTISDPNIVWFLMIIGLAGLYFEFSHPGAIFPGVIGGISLILFLFSIQTIPVNYTGLLLIVLAIILFIAEIKITSYGILSIGGVISFTLGSIMLFEDVGVSLKLMAPTIVLISGFFVGVSFLAFRAQRSKPQSGMEGLVGEVGIVKQRIDPEGKVFVHGELWRAVSREKIEPNEKVEVEEMQGLVLKVRKAINTEY